MCTVWIILEFSKTFCTLNHDTLLAVSKFIELHKQNVNRVIDFWDSINLSSTSPVLSQRLISECEICRINIFFRKPSYCCTKILSFRTTFVFNILSYSYRNSTNFTNFVLARVLQYGRSYSIIIIVVTSFVHLEIQRDLFL